MFSELVPLSPSSFFALSLEIHAFKKLPLDKTHHLPNLSELHGERSLSAVYLGWSSQGLALSLDAQKLETVDLFFDTRDNKASMTPTRFCHHFHLTLDPLEIQEKTRFRGLEQREHCDSSLIKITSGKMLTLFFPADVLFGFDPSQFRRLGFTYHLQAGERSQDFSPSSEDFTLENHPQLWSSLKLIS